MEHFVKIDSLPPGLEFPASYQDRIRFDPDRKRLVYQGFMSKADFDRLYLLSDSWAYRRALEELFRECTDDAKGHGTGLWRIFSRLRHG